MKTRIIGLDLDQPFSQLTVYSEASREPETVSTTGEGQEFLIPTPKELFALVRRESKEATGHLVNYLRRCFGLLKSETDPAGITLCVTMREMKPAWIRTIQEAAGRLGIGRLSLQTHRESFFAYMVNQKKVLWQHKVVLFEYEEQEIRAYVFSADYQTRPALVTVTEADKTRMSHKNGKNHRGEEGRKDQLFFELIQRVFQKDSVSCVYLIGEGFEGGWMNESLNFLCRKRHVFQGSNLYTKGACYTAMARAGISSALNAFLYRSEDLVETNLSMQMSVKGRQKNQLLVSAGRNWYETEGSCELLLDDEEELVIYSKSMMDGTVSSYSIALPDLPKRPPRTTRLELKFCYTAANRCRVTIRDLGFGVFFPSSGLRWESELEV
ncbi:MAG: DUF5716 family protein [Eubacteriales bacterium]|nr:DUF5716 family protein [Eubacteriales bacterium]